jgi:hypothetical protein
MSVIKSKLNDPAQIPGSSAPRAEISESDRLGYKVPSAAKKADLSETRLWDDIRRGNLRAKKAGRCTIILADELRRYLNNLPDRTPQQQSVA